jgi:hypothetical protein
MALFLLYRKTSGPANERGLHSVIVNAADAATAISQANAKAPWGPSCSDFAVSPYDKGLSAWGVLDLSTATANQVLWIQGDAVSVLGVDRGGNRFP